MTQDESKEDARLMRHEKATWIGTISMVLQLAASGYDFTSQEGTDVLEEAQKSLAALENALAKK